MKSGDIQADKIFPITEEYHPKRDYVEQLRQAGYLRRNVDWTETGPFKKLGRLPMPLRIPALTIAYTALILCFLIVAAWQTSSRNTKGAKRHGRKPL